MQQDWTPYVAIATNIIRHLLTAAGAFGFTWAQTVSGDQVQMVVGSFAMIVSVVWGVVQKIRAQSAIVTATNLPTIAPPPKLPA